MPGLCRRDVRRRWVVVVTAPRSLSERTTVVGCDRLTLLAARNRALLAEAVDIALVVPQSIEDRLGVLTQ